MQNKQTCLILFPILCCAASAKPKPILVTILADESYFPYSYVYKGELTGAYTQAIKATLKNMPTITSLSALSRGKEVLKK